MAKGKHSKKFTNDGTKSGTFSEEDLIEQFEKESTPQSEKERIKKILMDIESKKEKTKVRNFNTYDTAQDAKTQTIKDVLVDVKDNRNSAKPKIEGKGKYGWVLPTAIIGSGVLIGIGNVVSGASSTKDTEERFRKQQELQGR